MNTQHLFTYIATLGPIGYFVMPGTMATLISLPLLYWFKDHVASLYVYTFLVCLIMCIAFISITQALLGLRRFDDPSEIVIDEMVGCLVTFWGISLSTSSLCIGFLLFRFFDILKYGGVRYFERFAGAWGILLDDIFAGILSNIILRIFFG